MSAGAISACGSPAGIQLAPAHRAFSYGFDYTIGGPYSGAGSNLQAITSARRVLASIPGMYEDTSIMSWGLGNPEPQPGQFNFSGIASRIQLITSTGGTPVITLCTAPGWMTNGGMLNPPTPAHYQDFATLAAKIAASFPQVKYFVVWNEFKGFWSKTTGSWNVAGYTAMYNDVYKAIKRVRPDAMVGGPYAPTPPSQTPLPGNLLTTPHGAWGYLDQRTLDAVRYWLDHMTGADFVAVDGADYPKDGPITGPLIATQKFVAVDHWLRQQTSLPIWWIESPVQPAGSQWTEARAAAVRVAALIQFASTGVTAGMQWQPTQGQGIPDEGLWTGTSQANGGHPTPLAHVLPGVLSVLRYRLSKVTNPNTGILIATGQGGTIALNASPSPVTTVIAGQRVTLASGQVRVTSPRNST